MPAPTDRHGRPLGNLRISVTDRCNLRCDYCMPEEEYSWLPRADILRFEEIARLVDAFVSVGVQRVRLTGGEPLLRRDLPLLVEMLAAQAGLRDIALTTNGILLGDQAEALRRAGLHRVSISLDSLVRERYRTLTQRDELARALSGIEATRAAGFTSTKLNTVVMRGVNDDELVPMLEFARANDLEARFIEYMDVGGATRWAMKDVVSRDEILTRLGEHYGQIESAEAAGARGTAPADRFRLPDGTVFGVIASVTAPFCGTCDRSRVTADGMWYGCLYARKGTDLRGPLRAGAGREELARCILGLWEERSDRGAEERLGVRAREGLVSVGDLKRDPHLEMHTRGG